MAEVSEELVFSRYTYANGNVYDGTWKKNMKHGKGTFKCVNGDKYIGDWVDDQMHGKGTYYSNNGDRYEGMWAKGLRHGRGVYVYENGNRYNGQWDVGKSQGRGVYTLSNGDRYEGDWKKYKMHGKGKFISKSGEQLEGEWQEGNVSKTLTRSFTENKLMSETVEITLVYLQEAIANQDIDLLREGIAEAQRLAKQLTHDEMGSSWQELLTQAQDLYAHLTANRVKTLNLALNNVRCCCRWLLLLLFPSAALCSSALSSPYILPLLAHISLCEQALLAKDLNLLQKAYNDAAKIAFTGLDNAILLKVNSMVRSLSTVSTLTNHLTLAIKQKNHHFLKTTLQKCKEVHMDPKTPLLKEAEAVFSTLKSGSLEAYIYKYVYA